MVHFLFKWLVLCCVLNNNTATGSGFREPGDHHPIFVSVTEIEHNAKDKTLDISCKIYTDDFEKTLRKTYKGTVDLLNPKDKNAMNKLVREYVQKHLLIKVDGKAVALQFVGYEQDEEGIMSYYQVSNITSVKKIEVTDNILFEYKNEQISIVHAIVNGKRQSTKLINPDEKYSFTF